MEDRVIKALSHLDRAGRPPVFRQTLPRFLLVSILRKQKDNNKSRNAYRLGNLSGAEGGTARSDAPVFYDAKDWD